MSPPAAAGPARPALLLAATILGSAIVFIDSTVVNVALPALARDLDASLAEQQWVVEAYLLTLGSLVLVGGSLGDLLGRRRVFVWGVIGFGLTSVLCAAAPSAGALIAFRALQGVAGALLVPSSLAIITAAFRGDAERGAAIGSWTAWTSAAIALGPALGGLLVDAVSWRLVFAINVPVAIAALALAARGVPAFPGRPGTRVDVAGGVLCALGLGGPVFALIEAPARGWGDPLILASLVGGLVLLGVFVLWEARWARAPMLPLGLFRSRNFAVGNVATFGIYAGLGAATFFVALFLQEVAGYTALAGGLALLPITLMILALSRRFGALAGRLGPRLFMGAGPLVCSAGLLLWLLVDERGTYVTQVLPGSLVFGLGLAMTVAPLTATVLGAAPRERAGIASGVNNAIARVASLLAIAIVGAVVTAVLLDRGGEGAARLGEGGAAASVAAFHAGLVCAAVLVALGGIVSLAGIENQRADAQATT